MLGVHSWHVGLQTQGFVQGITNASLGHVQDVQDQDTCMTHHPTVTDEDAQTARWIGQRSNCSAS